MRSSWIIGFFKELKALREKYEDKNHIIAIAGEPMHLGYVDYYMKDVVKILAYTVIAMMVVFLLYFRSMRGMFLPILAAAVSAVWGLGFLSLLGFNLDPLVLVFPVSYCRHGRLAFGTGCQTIQGGSIYHRG